LGLKTVKNENIRPFNSTARNYNAPVRTLGSSVDYVVKPRAQKLDKDGAKDFE
jgi:hypothetical protein